MNPYDVFPRRNLPPEAEEWGRKAEERIIDIENRVLMADGIARGTNRGDAASMGALARQVDALAAQVQRINEVYLELPKAYAYNASATNFGIGAGWQNIATIQVTPPQSGIVTLTASASGQARSNTTTETVQVNWRLAFGSNTSPVTPGLWSTPDGVWRSSFFFQYGWNYAVSEGVPITVALQAAPSAASAWPSGTGSYAALTVNATFSK